MGYASVGIVFGNMGCIAINLYNSLTVIWGISCIPIIVQQ